MRKAQSNGRYAEWLAVFDSYKVQYLVLDRKDDRGLLQAAQADPQWQVDLRQGDSVLLARVGSSSPGRIAA